MAFIELRDDGEHAPEDRAALGYVPNYNRLIDQTTSGLRGLETAQRRDQVDDGPTSLRARHHRGSHAGCGRATAPSRTARSS